VDLRPTFPLLLLPIIHAALCVVIQNSPGEWQWFPVFMTDFPLSIVLEHATVRWPHFILYFVGGTLWWYLLGCLARLLYRRATSFA
jgi:hypothetical protein